MRRIKMLNLRRILCSAVNRHDYTSLRSASSLKSYMATNEPVLDYAPGSGERMALEDALRSYEGKMTEVPVIVGDDQHFRDEFRYQLCPADHQRQVAKYHFATKELIQKAIDVSQKVRPAWEKKPLEERAEIFLKTADLMSTKYRADMNATSMIGQGKTIIQAEIDSACELIDFLRFNVQFAMDMAKYQPVCTPTDTNYLSFRGCEGFWAAITPFNFTAIGGHLPSAPAFMGNTVLWKPAGTAVLSNYTFYKILREAGLPPGVINFLPSSGPVFGETITSSPHLAGINFTGSVETYQRVTAMVTKNLHLYRTFPRLIGECGGKNFHLVHPSADVTQVVYHTIRAAFEYSGQKCSACSRLYVPHSLWPQIKDMFVEEYKKIKLGSPLEFDSFLSAVIDKASFQNIKSYLDYAKENPNLNIVVGGGCDDSKGWFVEPTIIETSDPKDKLMQEEIFGPVLTVYVYPDKKWEETLHLVDTTSPFALTGAIFAQDQSVIEGAQWALRQASGNFYINVKCTGSVVGQQPFGGARLSGTNDKAGGPQYLARFCSPQAVKVSTQNISHWSYPSMRV